jgi:DNA-binding protein HU-beta
MTPLLYSREPLQALRRKSNINILIIIVTTRIPKQGVNVAKLMSKSELVQKIAEQHPNNMTRKDVKGVIESLAEIGYKELKKTGAFFVPGFAKFVVIKKPATKARKGINPFTKEPTIFKAKPARKIVRARPVKAAKDAVS